MKKMLIAASIAALGSVSAHAADLAAQPYSKAPVYAEPAFNWSGFYAGLNVGYGVSSSPTTETFSLLNLVPITSHTADLNARGVVGGGQVGYNFQFSPNALFGVEVDVQGTNQKGSLSNSTLFGLLNNSVESRLEYFGTARGRLGWIVTPSTLLYFTGGFAWGELKTTGSNSVVFGLINSSRSVESTNTGWTAGGGIETKLAGNWTAKAEYLYLDLGKQTVNTPELIVFNQQSTVNFRDHVVRAGINYHFN